VRACGRGSRNGAAAPPCTWLAERHLSRMAACGARPFRHGHGTLTYANGDYFEGEWREGAKHGTGSFTYVSRGRRCDNGRMTLGAAAGRTTAMPATRRVTARGRGAAHLTGTARIQLGTCAMREAIIPPHSTDTTGSGTRGRPSRAATVRSCRRPLGHWARCRPWHSLNRRRSCARRLPQRSATAVWQSEALPARRCKESTAWGANRVCSFRAWTAAGAWARDWRAAGKRAAQQGMGQNPHQSFPDCLESAPRHTMRRAAVVLALLVAWPGLAAALYSSTGPVIQLTPDNFEAKIKKGGVWVVEFYAPW
jgi:hypothetical protein